jgi:hypothetical protein
MLSPKFSDMFQPQRAVLRHIYDDSRKVLYCIKTFFHRDMYFMVGACACIHKRERERVEEKAI